MNKITETIQRVTEMESIYDQALKIMDNVENSQEEFLKYQTELMKLADYYSSQDWKDDFALDEEGELPQDLKRGVLSEDGVYNLLEKNKELLEEYGKELGIHTPYNEFAFHMLKALEEKNDGLFDYE